MKGEVKRIYQNFLDALRTPEASHFTRAISILYIDVNDTNYCNYFSCCINII